MKTQTISTTSKFITGKNGLTPYAIFLCDDINQQELTHPDFTIQKWYIGSHVNNKNAVYTVLFIKSKQSYQEPDENQWYEFLRKAIKYMKTITRGPVYFSHESGRLIPLINQLNG